MGGAGHRSPDRSDRLLQLAVLLLCTLGCAVALTSTAAATAPYVRRLPPLVTPWTQSVSTVAPLPDYPRPQLARASWLSLNGRWQYEAGQPGEAPPVGRNLAETILVPFPVQAPLSGIGRDDTRGWYRRTFTIPPAWGGRHVVLNFGALAWQARVYVNGRLAATHSGDYEAFSLDITHFLNRAGPNELLVGYYNPIGAAGEPVGKQVPSPPHGIFHTASSGIWQTVWLEPVAPDHVTALDLVPDIRRARLSVGVSTSTAAPARLSIQILSGSRVVASATRNAGRPTWVPVPHPRLWSPGDPYLYGLRLRLMVRTKVIDDVRSYFGMRSISLGRVAGATRILLNGRFVFETGALDQGYWPDGLYAAPSDAALRFDISAAKRLGYNLLREHQKVQPDRWYYWADRLGILVWQDMPAMRPPPGQAPSQGRFRAELSAIVRQERSHPSLVAWVPFNEAWDQFDPAGITRQVKTLDPGALVDSDSGSANCCHAVQPPNSDISDTHLYFGPYSVAARAQASVIGEYGGVLAFPPAAHRWPGPETSLGSPVLAWGISPVASFLRQQYRELAQEMRVRGASGAVFTQLAGYENELGILTYDRQKFTMPVGLVHSLNGSLLAASQRSSSLTPQPPAVPRGSAGLWQFSEGHGVTAADSSGHHHPLTLEGGAGWTRGPFGGALAISAPGQAAVATAALVNPRRPFTISVWLSSRRGGESGTAVSEPGPDGSSFSLGIETARQGRQSLNGLPGAHSPPQATWWTFVVPASSSCTSAQCGVRANMRYDDGRFDPRVGSWHQVTGAYDAGTQTTAIYVDGIPEDVEHVFGIPPARGPLTVGAGLDDYMPADSFIGAIARLRIYSRALSPGEVWQLYRAERPGR